MNFPNSKCRVPHRLQLLAGALGFFMIATAGRAADFTVTSPGFFFSINGQSPNPTLTLVRGQTYTFAVSTSSIHPFEIQGAGTNVSNNNISSGTITFKVPTNDVNYSYICSIHFFGGKILTVPPSQPPTIRIVKLSVSTNLVLTSTGTNTLSLFPEFKTNLNDSAWASLTVQTNQFANGTNDTICGLPFGTNVFIRIRAQQ
jgi:hypothetical protein